MPSVGAMTQTRYPYARYQNSNGQPSPARQEASSSPLHRLLWLPRLSYIEELLSGRRVLVLGLEAPLPLEALQAADEVVVLDPSPVRIRYVQNRTSAQNVGYRVSELLESGLPGGSFDIIFAYDAPISRDFCTESRRLLSTDGFLFLVQPGPARLSLGLKAPKPAIEPVEVRSQLRRYFAHAEQLVQQQALSITLSPRPDQVPSWRMPVSGGGPGISDYIYLCSQLPIQLEERLVASWPLPPLLNTTTRQRERLEHRLTLQSLELEALQAEIQSLKLELEDRGARLGQLEAGLSPVQERISESDLVLLRENLESLELVQQSAQTQLQDLHIALEEAEGALAQSERLRIHQEEQLVQATTLLDQHVQQQHQLMSRIETLELELGQGDTYSRSGQFPLPGSTGPRNSGNDEQRIAGETGSFVLPRMGDREHYERLLTREQLRNWKLEEQIGRLVALLDDAGVSLPPDLTREALMESSELPEETAYAAGVTPLPGTLDAEDSGQTSARGAGHESPSSPQGSAFARRPSDPEGQRAWEQVHQHLEPSPSSRRSASTETASTHAGRDERPDASRLTGARPASVPHIQVAGGLNPSLTDLSDDANDELANLNTLRTTTAELRLPRTGMSAPAPSRPAESVQASTEQDALAAAGATSGPLAAGVSAQAAVGSSPEARRLSVAPGAAALDPDGSGVQRSVPAGKTAFADAAGAKSATEQASPSAGTASNPTSSLHATVGEPEPRKEGAKASHDEASPAPERKLFEEEQTDELAGWLAVPGSRPPRDPEQPASAQTEDWISDIFENSNPKQAEAVKTQATAAAEPGSLDAPPITEAVATDTHFPDGLEDVEMDSLPPIRRKDDAFSRPFRALDHTIETQAVDDDSKELPPYARGMRTGVSADESAHASRAHDDEADRGESDDDSGPPLPILRPDPAIQRALMEEWDSPPPVDESREALLKRASGGPVAPSVLSKGANADAAGLDRSTSASENLSASEGTGTERSNAASSRPPVPPAPGDTRDAQFPDASAISRAVTSPKVPVRPDDGDADDPSLSSMLDDLEAAEDAALKPSAVHPPRASTTGAASTAGPGLYRASTPAARPTGPTVGPAAPAGSAQSAPVLRPSTPGPASSAQTGGGTGGSTSAAAVSGRSTNAGGENPGVNFVVPGKVTWPASQQPSGQAMDLPQRGEMALLEALARNNVSNLPSVTQQEDDDLEKVLFDAPLSEAGLPKGRATGTGATPSNAPATASANGAATQGMQGTASGAVSALGASPAAINISTGNLPALGTTIRDVSELPGGAHALPSHSLSGERRRKIRPISERPVGERPTVERSLPDRAGDERSAGAGGPDPLAVRLGQRPDADFELGFQNSGAGPSGGEDDAEAPPQPFMRRFLNKWWKTGG